MANKFIGETSGKYWKQKNDETYVNEDELVKITDLEEGETVDDDDLLIKGNSSTGTMLRIKVANFLDGIKEKLLGNTDISSVGDGTVTGAISENAENISANKEETDSAIDELNSALAVKSNALNTSYIEQDNITVEGDSLVTGSISASKSGYTPLGIIGVNINNATTDGVNNSRCYINRFYLGTSGDVNYQICNRNTSAAAIIRVRFYVLYVAN